MATTTVATASGRDGVVVADTRLSEVDGEGGRLVVAGHDIERLACGGGAGRGGGRSDAVFADVRGRSGGGVVRAHPRAAGDGAADPAGVAVRRADAGGVIAAAAPDTS